MPNIYLLHLMLVVRFYLYRSQDRASLRKKLKRTKNEKGNKERALSRSERKLNEKKRSARREEKEKKKGGNKKTTKTLSRKETGERTERNAGRSCLWGLSKIKGRWTNRTRERQIILLSQVKVKVKAMRSVQSVGWRMGVMATVELGYLAIVVIVGIM